MHARPQQRHFTLLLEALERKEGKSPLWNVRENQDQPSTHPQFPIFVLSRPYQFSILHQSRTFFLLQYLEGEDESCFSALFYPRPTLNFPTHLAREILSVPICSSSDLSNNDHQSVSLRDFRPRLLIFFGEKGTERNIRGSNSLVCAPPPLFSLGRLMHRKQNTKEKGKGGGHS